MLAENLFEKIEYSDKAIGDYNKYHKIIGDCFDPIASKIVKKEITFADGYKSACEMFPDISDYTCGLMLVIESTGYLLEEYKSKGYPDEMFYCAMQDIRAKTNECYALKGVFGTFVPEWFDYFLIMKRLAFGRFQYDILRHEGAPITVKGHTITEGELCLNCHIPSLGKLDYENDIKSFYMAYEFFKNELKDGVLVIICFSWLLFPLYSGCFKECSESIMKFKKDFALYKVDYSDRFDDAWRIFNTESIDDPDSLPNDTRMRKAFIDYIKKNRKKEKPYGEGYGALLFDGKNILTDIKDSLI